MVSKIFYNRCFYCRPRTNIYNNCDTKRYVAVVNLSTEDDAILLQQLKSGFKRKLNWNKDQSKVTTVQEQNWYLDSLITPSIQGVNRLFVISFENNGGRPSYTR